MKRLTLLLVALALSLAGCSLMPEPRFVREHRRQKAACEQARKYGWYGRDYESCKDHRQPKIRLPMAISEREVAPSVGAAGRRAP